MAQHSLPNPMHVVDVAALTVIVGAWAQLVPAIAAVVAALWYAVQIWESDTVRKWTNRVEPPPGERHSDYEGE